MTQINLVEDILIFSYIHVVLLDGLFFFSSYRHVSDDKNNHLVKFWQTEESDTTTWIQESDSQGWMSIPIVTRNVGSDEWKGSGGIQ